MYSKVTYTMSQFFVSANEIHVKKERNKAQKLKKTKWWKEKLHHGLCYYCTKKYPKKDLSMDHVIPLVRGGHSDKNNIVLSCKKCNANKKYKTIVEL